MRRVEANQSWSLMCPRKYPGLSDVWGDDFVKLYKKYVKVYLLFIIEINILVTFVYNEIIMN